MNRKGNKVHPFPKQTAHCVITTKKKRRYLQQISILLYNLQMIANIEAHKC